MPRTLCAVLLALIALTPTLSLAQAPSASAPANDPAFLQSALQALQAQRNAALDNAAGLQAQLVQAQQENAKLKDELAKATAKPGAPGEEKKH